MERALNLNLKNADQESWSFFEIQYRTEYEYDSFSNLKKVTFPDGKVVEYKTDAMNRRVKKMVNGSVKEYYLWYDQQRLAAILDENKAPKLIYLYGPESGHSPSYLVKNNKTYKLVQDAGTGSIRYIVDPTNIYVVQELEYDEFGNIMRNSNPSFQPVLFAGGLYDEDTRLVKFGARDYDPTIGRWTTKDPIGFAGGDTNLYAYVGGNPMSYIDPMGLSQEQIDSALVWIGANRPDLLKGINPKGYDVPLPGPVGGWTIPGTEKFFIDTRNSSDAWVLGRVVHELLHIKKGFLFTVFDQTDIYHGMIDSYADQVMGDYMNSKEKGSRIGNSCPKR